jgi:hypothetical protein
MKGTYFHALFHRIRSRRGVKKAIVAVAASILTAIYHMLKDGTMFLDLCPVHFDRRTKEQQKNRLVKRPNALAALRLIRLIFRGRLHRQIGRLVALEDPINVNCRPSKQIIEFDPICGETALPCMAAEWINREHPMVNYRETR